MTIIFAILLFSLLVFVHELGHFIAAKASGVQVNEFSIFMGPALVKWERGETKYSIRCIPFGGYCAMEGENEDTDNPRSFLKAAWWKRLIILVAGSFMNFVAGLLILLIIYMPVKQLILPQVAIVEEGSLVGGENGLQVGDTILELDGEKILMQADFNMILSLNPGEVHDIVLERNGEKVYLDDFVMRKTLFPGEETERYGFSFSIVDSTPALNVKTAWNSALDYVRVVRLSLRMIFTGEAGLQDVSGPVGIVQQMNQTAQEADDTLDAILDMLDFGAMIAINLAVMNLLPIPALDGGRVVGLLLTTAVEKITRKKLNAKYEAYIHGVGMILLLALMAVILFKDVFFIFKG